MILLYNYSYINKAFNVTNRNFSREYYYLLHLYNYTDAWFIYKNQKIYVSVLGADFFDGDECQAFHKLGTDTIIFNFIYKHDISARGQYGLFQEPFKSYDICMLPFSWYTRDPIFNTDSGYIRAINNSTYQIQSLGFTPLAWQNERDENNIYSNPLGCIAYNRNGDLLPYKNRPTGTIQETDYFRLSFPSVIDTILFYAYPENDVTATITYGDDAWQNKAVVRVKRGLNEVYMFQDNPTNPRIFEVLPPSSLLRSMVGKPYYNYQLSDEFQQGRLQYNSDRTLTILTPKPPITQKFGFYRYDYKVYQVPDSIIFITTPQSLDNFTILLYDDNQSCVYEANLVNFFTNASYNKTSKYLKSNAYLSGITDNFQSTITIQKSGPPIQNEYGLNNILTKLGMPMLICIDNFIDNNTTITIGNYVENSNHFCYGLYNSVIDVGDINYYCSNLISQITSTTNETWTYDLYLIKNSDINFTQLNQNQTIPYYQKLTFVRTGIRYPTFEYNFETIILIHIYTNDGFNPPFPQPQHYGYFKKTLSGSTYYTNKFIFYKPFLPFNTTDNDSLILYNSSNNGVTEYNRQNSNLGHQFKYFFYNFYDTNVNQYYRLSRTNTSSLINNTIDRLFTTMSSIEGIDQRQGCSVVGTDAIGLRHPNVPNFSIAQQVYFCTRVDTYTVDTNAKTLTIGPLPASAENTQTYGFWCWGLDYNWGAPTYSLLDSTLEFSNLICSIWFKGVWNGYIAQIFLFDYDQIPITYSTTRTYYEFHQLFSGQDGAKFEKVFTRPTKVLVIFRSTSFDPAFRLYDDWYPHLSCYAINTPVKLFPTPQYMNFNTYPSNPIGYRIMTPTNFSPLVNCVPPWTVWSLPSNNYTYQWRSYAWNMPSLHSLSFILLSKTYQLTGVSNYVFHIIYQRSGGAWDSWPNTTSCDPSTWIQEGVVTSISYNSNNDIVAWFPVISKTTKTITKNEIENDVEFFSFFTDNSMNVLTPNTNLNLVSNICNIGNSIDGTIDFLGNPVLLGDPIYNIPSTIPKLTDWIQTEKINIGVSPTRLFTNTSVFINNVDNYYIRQGLAPWDSEITFNNNKTLSTSLILDKTIPIDSVQFIFISNVFKQTRQQDYQIMFYFNTLPLSTWTESSYFYEGDTIVFGGGPTFDVISIQIKKISETITINDIPNLFIYYYINGLAFTPNFDLESNNILSVGTLVNNIDLLNNPVPLGMAIKNIPIGNDHIGTYELEVTNAQNSLFSINHNYNFYQDSVLQIKNQFNQITEIIIDQNLCSQTYLYIPTTNSTNVKFSYSQQTSLDNDSFMMINKISHSNFYRHVWLGELDIVDPTTNNGTVDVSTGFKIFNFVDSINDDGNNLTIGNESAIPTQYLLMNLDVGQADYTYFGSNIFLHFENINIPSNLTYTIFRISSKTSPIITFNTQFNYYNKQVYNALQQIQIDEFFTVIPSRIIVLISSPTTIDLNHLKTDTIKIGCLPTILFTNINYLNYNNNYTCKKQVSQFGNVWAFNPKMNANGGIRLNGFANSINNPNTSVPLGYLVQSKLFKDFKFINYKYCFFTNNIDQTLSDNFIYQSIQDDGQGYFIMPSEFDNNLIYLQINNFNNSFASPEEIFNNFEVLVGCFNDFNFPVASLLNFSTQYNSINFGNSLDGLYKDNNQLVTKGDLIPIPQIPQPSDEFKNQWFVFIEPNTTEMEVGFTVPTRANFYFADIYISDFDDPLHYSIWATKIKLTPEFLFNGNMAILRDHLTRAINLQPNNVGLNLQPGNRIILPTRTPAKIGFNIFNICASEFIPLALQPLCNIQPPPLIIIPINRLYDYTIVLTEPCIDIVFGARKPYVGQPLLSENAMPKFEYANKYAIGYDHDNSLPSPHSTTLARQILFPSMTDFYNNYAYSLSRTGKHVDSSLITCVEQEWKSNENYIYTPASATEGVTVDLYDFNRYQDDQTELANFYNLNLDGINKNLPYCDYNRIMRDGIRIFKSYFNYDAYLNQENILTNTMLIQRINWTVLDSTLPIYISQVFNFTHDLLPNFNRVGAYVPFIGEQLPDVTIKSDYNNWTSCFLTSTIVPYKRGLPQPLFIQNNRNRTINFVNYNQTRNFTLMCSTTPQYIFLCFQ